MASCNERDRTRRIKSRSALSQLWQTGTLHREVLARRMRRALKFSFLTLKVSLSVLGRTLESRRSIYVQYGCTQKLSGPAVQAAFCLVSPDWTTVLALMGPETLRQDFSRERQLICLKPHAHVLKPPHPPPFPLPPFPFIAVHRYSCVPLYPSKSVSQNYFVCPLLTGHAPTESL